MTYGYVDEDGVALVDGGGTEILASHDDVTGPGGADLFLDDDGTVYMVYRKCYPAVYFNLSLNMLP